MKKVKMKVVYFFGLESDDFTSPCVSLLCNKSTYRPEVSDISDGESDFQQQNKRYYVTI